MGDPATYLPDLDTAHHAVGNALQPGDLLITLGAGNVHEAGTRIAADLKILEEMRALMPAGEIDGKLYEPMSKHTTLLVGGPAQFWMEPHSFYGFAFLVGYCRERGIPVRVVGRGSNLLVRDGGIRGAVIHPTGGAFSDVSVGTRGEITAGAGVRLKKLASVAGQRHRRLRVDGRHPRQRRRRAAHERRRHGHRNFRSGGARHLPR
jgi:UDP-N-acetylmuramate--alanine ligase